MQSTVWCTDSSGIWGFENHTVQGGQRWRVKLQF